MRYESAMRLFRRSWNRVSPWPAIRVPVSIPAPDPPATEDPAVRDAKPPSIDAPFARGLPCPDASLARSLTDASVPAETAILELGARLWPEGWERVESVSFGPEPGVRERVSGTLVLVLPLAGKPTTAFERFLAFWDAAAMLRRHMGSPDAKREARMAARWISILPSLRESP